MGFPVATKTIGVCVAFPDMCWTPVPIIGEAPIPYANVGQLSQTEEVSQDVLILGNGVILVGNTIEESTGDEAGVNNGVSSGEIQGKIEFTTGSATVLVNGKQVVRMFDTTTQNNGNAVGVVIGGEPTVKAGG